MSSPVVVDSCVAYKWLSAVGEQAVTQAESLLDDHQAGECVLVAPTTLHVELANALRYTELAPEAVLALVKELDAFAIELFEPTSERLRTATALSYQHDISVYDALFLQLAEELRCPLVTADRKAFAGIDTEVDIIQLL